MPFLNWILSCEKTIFIDIMGCFITQSLNHMDWIKEYQLFLLDFDGLLVNTEKLHYQAYLRMCHKRGFDLNWSFEDFCTAAHYDSKQLRVKLFETLPGLYAQESDWSTLYTEKKKCYLEILKETPIELMPGVEELLYALNQHKIKRCVVTHSPREQVEFIRPQHKALQTLTHWITREDYQLAKPHPEPYLKAIERHGVDEDKIIGFEDSPRGLSALLGTRAHAVLVNPFIAPKIEHLIEQKKVTHVPSFLDITKAKLLQ